ncbi:rhodanese-like domain-containing protein [Halalkalibacillus sediminis]|uniref:Rhodanese-like domain-containing protein n=1 Tax=Halalkalibacillus sediminis TaxID=2018042 RepID=A0A2I0QVM3_9BACI|nr:rhodanese-like domain-containing protein [Halalkalibacillus sediminis]PKR78150.1 rhodanese-like domain-containing protein [Halalkalibacillus sediminis]
MSQPINEVTSDELLKDLEDQQRYKVIDVREDEEVAQGMIPGAKHIALQTVPERLGELSKDKEYVIVCRSGRRSHNACLFLDEQGYKVNNLKGGMLDWNGEVVF